MGWRSAIGCGGGTTMKKKEWPGGGRDQLIINE